mmetsp:Transcript_49358/g.115416  ORF Transcript_49358/g.115416 Transcript_49358/m.115416 type:complete len:324 (+) Transcript_49358:391-1362(+)
MTSGGLLRAASAGAAAGRSITAACTTCFCRFAFLSRSAFSRAAFRLRRLVCTSNSSVAPSPGGSAVSSTADACHSAVSSRAAASEKIDTRSTSTSASSLRDILGFVASPSLASCDPPLASAFAAGCSGLAVVALLSSRSRLISRSSAVSSVGAGPDSCSRSCCSKARKFPTKAAALKGMLSFRRLPVTFERALWTSDRTPLRVASSTLSVRAAPGSKTAKNTDVVGQLTNTVWHKRRSSSPTCSQAASTSSASVSSSDWRGVASHRSSATPNSAAKRCAQCVSRKAQLTVTEIGWPSPAVPTEGSCCELKRRLRHIRLLLLKD